MSLAMGRLREYTQRRNAQNNENQAGQEPVREKIYSRSAFGFIRRKLDWNRQQVELTENERTVEKQNFLTFLDREILNNDSLTTQEKLLKLLKIEYVFENISVFADNEPLKQEHPDIAGQMSALRAICTHPELSESKYFLTRRLSAKTEQANDIKSILNKKKNELIVIRSGERAHAETAAPATPVADTRLNNTPNFDSVCGFTPEEKKILLQHVNDYTQNEEEPVQFFGKSQTGLKHSFLIFTDHEDGSVKVFIKPNTKNKDPSTAKGSFKKVKKDGFMLTFSPDKQTLLREERFVSVSKDSTTDEKDHRLQTSSGKAYREEGFKEIQFRDEKQKPRVIYMMPYLGERISTNWKDLRPHEKKEVALTLIAEVKRLNANDVKSPNILLLPPSSPGEKPQVSVIDFKDKVSTFTPFGIVHRTRGGRYETADDEKLLAEARIFSLTLTLWELFNLKPNALNQIACYNEIKGPLDAFSKLLDRIPVIYPVLNAPLKKAYDCRLTFDELEEGIRNLNVIV